jgi:hypothetical protein
LLGAAKASQGPKVGTWRREELAGKKLAEKKLAEKTWRLWTREASSPRAVQCPGP